MEPVSSALTDSTHYHEKDLERNDGLEEADLLKKWGMLNWGRVALGAMAGGVGLWALM